MRPRVRKLLLDLHIYSGLVCAGYLVIYGLSSLAFNHSGPFFQAAEEIVEWERQLTLPATHEPQARAAEIREALGLIGYAPPWLIRADAQDFEFQIRRPGKAYRVNVSESDGRVRVQETRRGIWSVLIGLHGMHELPGSAWSRAWRVYTDFSIWAIAFSVLSGALVWWPLRSGQSVGWLALILGSGGGIALMLALWW